MGGEGLTEAPVFRRQLTRSGLRIRQLVGREERAEEAQQHAHVKPRRLREVRKQRALARDRHAGLREVGGELVDRAAHVPVSRQQRMALDHQDTKIAQRLMPRNGQIEFVGDAGIERIRSGHDVEQQGKIRCRARHRTDDGEVAFARNGRKRRRSLAARCAEIDGRLVSEDAAMKCRHTQGAADVGAGGERAIACGEGCRRSPG